MCHNSSGSRHMKCMPHVKKIRRLYSRKSITPSYTRSRAYTPLEMRNLLILQNWVVHATLMRIETTSAAEFKLKSIWALMHRLLRSLWISEASGERIAKNCSHHACRQFDDEDIVTLQFYGFRRN
jgi:hypothetical protein